VVPDAMSLAKGLGGGFPIGALITFGAENSALLSAGQHGTTFGGNPVATAAALATLHTIESQGVLEHVRSVGDHVRAVLAGLPEVAEVRGRGLLIGFDLALPAGVPAEANLAGAVVNAALDAGFIVNAPGPRTIRLAPPLILTVEQADTFLAALPDLVSAAVAALAPKEDS
jgi:acetylornithine aminotransferase